MDGISFGIGPTIGLSGEGIRYGIGVSIKLTGTTAIYGACIICGIFLLIMFGFIIYKIYTCCNNKKYVVEHDDINDSNCDDDGKIENNTYNIAKNK